MGKRAGAKQVLDCPAIVQLYYCMYELSFRYEIFMDEVRPDDLSVSFLKEFMSLPTSYYTPGSPIKYRKWKTPNRKKKKKGPSRAEEEK